MKPSISQLLQSSLEHLGDPAIVDILAELQQAYPGLSDRGKLGLFRRFGETLDIDGTSLPTLSQPFDPASEQTVSELLSLRQAVSSPRAQWLAQFVNVPGGTKFLVDMRGDLLRLIKAHPDVPSLRLVAADLFDLFQGWFNFGFLELRSINWETTPAAQLERMMAHDVVHPMASWEDLRRRLETDRLCYAFFHPNMPGEPLIFVEIALTTNITGNIDRLFKSENSISRIEEANTAIFYSINNTQPGLAGVSLGNSLIKMVVADLKKNYPGLKRFSTLSPIPGLRSRYVEPLLKGDASAQKFRLTLPELEAFFSETEQQTIRAAASCASFTDALRQVLADDDWVQEQDLRIALKPGMLRLTHFYLTQEKRKGNPLNPVANFHLKNGAEVYNINFLSNTSPKGLDESYGITVNYHYDLTAIGENQQAARSGTVVVSPQLEHMLSLGIGG